jgi:hypothetical protein
MEFQRHKAKVRVICSSLCQGVGAIGVHRNTWHKTDIQMGPLLCSLKKASGEVYVVWATSDIDARLIGSCMLGPVLSTLDFVCSCLSMSLMSLGEGAVLMLWATPHYEVDMCHLLNGGMFGRLVM